METVNNFLTNTVGSLGESLPTLIGAVLVLIIGMMVIKFVKKLITKALTKAGLDSKIETLTKSNKIKVSPIIGLIIYYVLVIYLLTIVLNIIGVTGVFEPVKELLSDILGYIPNIIAAGIIIYIGFIVGKIVSEMTEAIVGKLGSYLQKIGLDPEKINLAKIVKNLVFLMIFIPLLIVGLDALQMEVISIPATEMLSQLMNSIPSIIGAVVIILVFMVVGKFVTSLLVELLANLKVDELPAKMGFGKVLGDNKLSKIIGKIVFFFIAIMGITSGLEKLNLTSVVEVLNTIMNLGGSVLLGAVIIAIGNFLGNLGKKALSESNPVLGIIVKFSILVITFGMGLSAMGIGEQIVFMAFSLGLGAIAVAFALSFGLGGREAAGEQMKRILEKLNNK